MAILDAGFQLVEAEAERLNVFMMSRTGKASGYVPSLPEIDILEDERIWIALDEGCNATCHSPIWAENTEMRLRRYDLCFPWVHKIERSYTGIGRLSSIGKRVFQQSSRWKKSICISLAL